ncbi:aminoacyl--tRNA ligase-related protein, partial [Phenylobacterium sp.]|uniref:aminoacyl--tRNA ligase-related protein n=1 Tax=Phenylobacterium sp. TaxID=1871053 RepID=UPI002FE2B123
MHDIRAIRETPELYEKAWDSKRLSGAALVEQILALDATLRGAQTALQAAQAERNEASKKIGQAKAQKNEDEATRLMAHVETLKRTLEEQAEVERATAETLRGLLATLPNIPAPDVPVGESEEENVEVRRWGEPFAITAPKDHVDLGEALGLLDFEAAARMSGARFTVLKGQLARLERALGQFMLDLQTEEHGYLEVAPPLMVNDAAAYGTDKLPKFADDLFQTTDGRWLIPTAEVPLTSLVMDQIVAEEELPLRFTALTPCFRSEAGASGRDTRGMIRQHQFNKVELVSVV